MRLNGCLNRQATKSEQTEIMQVSVEKTSDLERKMTVQVPAERIESKISSRLNELRKQVRLKGFRPGKVPMNVIQQRYGLQVREEILNETMQSTLEEAIGQESLRVAGVTKLEPNQKEGQAHFEYVAHLEVFPDVPPLEFSDLKIQRPVCEVTEGDVDDMIRTLQEQRGDWVEVERKAQVGDRVRLGYVAKVDGERIPDVGQHEIAPVVGKLENFPDLEKLIKGAKAGDTISKKLKFPDNYRTAALAGKKVPLEIEIKVVEEAKLPEVTDEFAKEFGVEGGVEQLRADVRKNLEREMRNTITQRVKNRVTEGLLERFGDLPLPKSSIQQEARQMQYQLQQQMARPGQDAPQPPPVAQFMEGAEKRLRLGLLMGELAKQNDIKIDPDRVQAKLEEFAQTYEKPEEMIKIYRSDAQAMEQIENIVLEEQVLDLVLENANVQEKSMKFKELMESS